MADRYNALIVVLEQDIRSDDAEPIIEAIKQLRGVLSVEPNVADPGEFVTEMRVRNDLHMKLLRVINPDLYKDR